MMKLYTPTIEDLWFREKMLGDEQTMSYNHAYGGTIPFPEERWKSWYDRWITNHENKRFYRYIKENDTFIGEVAYHFDEERQRYMADVIVYAPYRKKGYGSKALLLLCDVAKDNGINELYDDIAIDNPSIELFLKCGFAEALRTDEYVLVKKEL
ncbi:MAG: GNAT family N-acetyltransferase [Bacilli bacterium]|jgi:RimJ/RimL family protein N-acetyltransferase